MHSYVCKLNTGGDNIFNSEFAVFCDASSCYGLNAIFGVDNLLNLIVEAGIVVY